MSMGAPEAEATFLVEGLATRALGRIVEVHETISSTNDRAKTLARAGAAHGLAIVAGQQSQGRGQRGRAWDSPRGLGLYVSFLMRPRIAPRAAPGLTLLSGLALLSAVEAVAGTRVALKWPNDLLVAEGPLARRKLAGILVEAAVDSTRIDHAVVGMGINLKERSWPPEIAATAASLEGCAGRVVSAARLYAALANALEPLLEEAEQDGLTGILPRIESRLAGRGETVSITANGAVTDGVLLGIAEDGALLLEASGGVTAFHGGELRLRGMAKTSLRG